MKIAGLFNKQFIRFLFVGGINTLFGYGIFALLIFLRLHYSLASLFATILGILFNFQTIDRFVFSSHQSKSIFRFVGVYGFIYILNVIGLYFFNIAKISNYISGAILIFPMALVAFYLNRRFVFNVI
ncbi:MAG: GtrA family protein [Patescibacteria group bacterium]